jgi:UDP-glucose 4-epimerase
MPRILITGSRGLIGVPLVRAFERKGYEVRGLDVRGVDGIDRGDVRVPALVREAVEGCNGVVHLAAVSRVVWGERDPDLCVDTNVRGTENVLRAIRFAKRRPWVLFASSREVYGRADCLPVDEDSPLRPVNVYARSKAAGERLMMLAREEGCRTAIARFSNVYGRIEDHPDRVVPAFARAAVLGEPMRVCGWNNTFDFTHVRDVVRGIRRLAGILQDGLDDLPPIHFVSGRPTTLGQLARLANQATGGASRMSVAPERDFDVSHFVGDPTRAASLLQWRTQISLEVGVEHLVRDFEENLSTEFPDPRPVVDIAFAD